MEKQCDKCGGTLQGDEQQCPNCGEPIRPPIVPTWLLVFFCIFFPPVGIYIIWKHTYLLKSLKKKLTIAICIWMVPYVIIGLTASNDSEDTEQTQDIAENENEDKSTDDNNNKEEKEPEENKEDKSSDKKEDKKKGENTKKESNKSEKTEDKKENKEPKKKKLSKSQYMKKCKEYDYKKVLRNPEKYTGKKVKIKVRISSVHTSGIINKTKYYFAYSESDYGWYGDRYAIMDKRSKEKPKLLDDDIIYVYGEIADPVDTVSLIVNSEELFAIDMKYVKLLEE